MRKIAILASGEGTNAEHIIQYFAGHPAIQVVVVIASKPTAGVIKRAESLNVPVEVLSKEVFEKGTVLEVLSRYAADFIVLAGFLLHIPSAVLHDYSGKIVNIHPSLLPKFGGKGMYGGHVPIISGKRTGFLPVGVIGGVGKLVDVVDNGCGLVNVHEDSPFRQGDPDLLRRQYVHQLAVLGDQVDAFRQFPLIADRGGTPDAIR